MKQRKMIAPIVITVVMVLYYLAFFPLIIRQVKGLPGVLLGLVPVALAFVIVAVCKQRIDEIRKGEEDDLGQY